MPRYVILRHDTPPGFPRPAHWDFMLEEGNYLRCWALMESPDSSLSQQAEALGDHRLAFLDYEGPLTGDRGSVRRWDQGTYDPVSNISGEDQLVLELTGARVRGQVTLTKMPDEPRYWRFSFAPAGSIA
jgi:hypothetical protein